MIKSRSQFMLIAMMAVFLTSCGEVTQNVDAQVDTPADRETSPSDWTIVISVSDEGLAYSWNTKPGVISTRLVPTTTDALLQKLDENDFDCDISKIVILYDVKNEVRLKTLTSRLTDTGCSGFALNETLGKTRE